MIVSVCSVLFVCEPDSRGHMKSVLYRKHFSRRLSYLK